MTEVPADVEAEMNVCGAMMISPNAIDAAVDVLEPDGESKFYRRETLGAIYRVAHEMHGAGHPVDVITLTDELALRGVLDRIGGRVKMHELAGLVPASANVGHYASIVREQWMLREVASCGAALQQMANTRDGSAEEILARSEDMVSRIRGRLTRERDVIVSMYEAAEYLDEKFRNPPEEGFGIPTPWSWLPSMHGGRLYVLAGYEKDGKTVQGAHFFRAAVSGGVKTDYITLEMNWMDLTERLAANMGVPAKRVQSGRLLPEHRDVAARVLGDMARYGDTGSLIDAPAADVATIRRLLQLRRPGFLIVDHLHQFSVRAEYERQDLEHIIRELWRMAREFDIPVLLLAQLARSGDKKHPYPRPTAAQLRGSGMIEKLAWAVWMIWRERDERNLATEKAEFIVSLNRSGPTGAKSLRFHDRDTKFTELQYGEEG